MAVKKILTTDKYEKLLRTKSEPVKKITKEIKELFQDIRDTIEENPAVGLAAAQIGVLKRIFGMRLGYQEEAEEQESLQPPMILVNPEILDSADESTRGFDACLSIRGMMGYTDRSVKVRVRYQDEDGKVQERDFEGFDARVVQHELDHLDGVLFTDRLNSLDDLYVYVRDDKGRSKPVPYPEVVRRAAEGMGDPAAPIVPALPGRKKV